jgi:hypothetical protein
VTNMDKENKIKDAETESASAEITDGLKGFYASKMKKISTEVVMVFLIGLLFGIAVKTEVAKRVNIADKTFYGKQSFDFAQMQKNAEAAQKAQGANSGAPQGGGNSGQ